MNNDLKDDNSNTVVVEREIVINKTRVRIISAFTGEKSVTEVLFIIADRKLKSG